MPERTFGRKVAAARLICWLATRGTTVAPAGALLRLAVLTTTVVLLLLGCALTPTALARSERRADHLLAFTPRPALDSGVLAQQADDYFDGRHITVVTVARVAGGRVPELGAGMRLPAPGELLVSPALASLRASSPQLAQRYDGRLVGDVPSARLQGPRDLQVWRGVTPAELPAETGWLRSTHASSPDIRDQVPQVLAYAYPVLLVGFLLPLLALVAVLATLGANRREQRLASLRLVGLSDRSAKWSATLEDVIVSLAGVGLGSALFAVLARPVAERLPGIGVWGDDVRLNLPVAILALAAFPLLTAAVTLFGLRNLTTSALGVERRSVVRRVGRWRLAPLLAGAALLAASPLDQLQNSEYAGLALILATGLLGVGLILSVPLIAPVVSRPLAGRWLSGLLAARRIQADPSGTSRTAVGLCLLVLTSGLMLIFLPLISESGAEDYRDAGSVLGESTLLATEASAAGPAAGRRQAWTRLGRLDSIDAAVRFAHLTVKLPGQDGTSSLLAVDCAALRRLVRISRADCAAGLRAPESSPVAARRVRVVAEVDRGGQSVETLRGPAFDVPAGARSSDLVTLINNIAGTDASLIVPFGSIPPQIDLMRMSATALIRPSGDRLEEARTATFRSLGTTSLTLDEQYEISTYTTRQYVGVAWTAAALIVLVAGLATLIALFDRVRATVAERRLLTIGGTPRRVLSRALALQTMVPVLIGVLPAAGLALVIAQGFVDLLARDGTALDLPVRGVLSVAAIAIGAPALATAVVLRLESRTATLQSLE